MALAGKLRPGTALRRNGRIFEVIGESDQTYEVEGTGGAMLPLVRIREVATGRRFRLRHRDLLEGFTVLRPAPTGSPCAICGASDLTACGCPWDRPFEEWRGEPFFRLMHVMGAA